MNKIQSISDLFHTFEMTKQPEKVVKTNNDVLALSVCLYRLYKNDNGARFISFADADSSVEITLEDVAVADAISDHFNKQIMVTSLREGKLSGFQEALAKFLATDRRSFSENNKGMIYRLPEFYEYDNDLASLVDSNYADFNTNLLNQPFRSEMNLVPVKSLRKNLRTKDVIQYWFMEVDKNTPVMLELKQDNPIAYIWDHLFTTRKTLLMDGRFKGDRHPSGLQYLTSHKWKIKDL